MWNLGSGQIDRRLEGLLHQGLIHHRQRNNTAANDIINRQNRQQGCGNKHNRNLGPSRRRPKGSRGNSILLPGHLCECHNHPAEFDRPNSQPTRCRRRWDSLPVRRSCVGPILALHRPACSRQGHRREWRSG